MFDWITGWLDQSGSVGVFVLMLVENVFPPIPSEVIMPMAGFLVQQGKLSMAGVILAGSLGSLLGTTIWYLLARWLGKARLRRFIARFGHWLTLSSDDLDRAEAWFQRHQDGAILLGRMVPGLRTLISVPAGLVRMSLARFLAVSLIGTALWTGALAAAGYALGSQFDKVADWVNPVTNLLLGAVLLAYLYRLIRQGRPRRD